MNLAARVSTEINYRKCVLGTMKHFKFWTSMRLLQDDQLLFANEFLNKVGKP